MRCQNKECGLLLPGDMRSHARHCSPACRSAARRQRDAAAKEALKASAADLLLRQTRAVLAGDTDELARIHAEADALFGKAS